MDRQPDEHVNRNAITPAAKEREALRQAGVILKMMMTPGGGFPSQRRLKRAWRLFRDLDLI